MRSGVIIAGCLLAGFAGSAAAQSPGSTDFVITFIGSPPVCPEGHGALQISGDAIWLLRSPAFPNTGRDAVGGVSKPVDDETYRYGITVNDCAVDLTLRAQVFRDGRWLPLLVPQSMRPSLRHSRSPEEVRKKIDEALAAAARRREGMTPQQQVEARQAWLQGPGPLQRSITIQQQTGGFGTFFAYEGMPENCVNAVGEYRLDQNGLTFRFPTNISDDYNRFAAELTRIDDYRGQLALARGGCRVEITIGKALRDHGRWVPIPIASIARPR